MSNLEKHRGRAYGRRQYSCQSFQDKNCVLLQVSKFFTVPGRLLGVSGWGLVFSCTSWWHLCWAHDSWENVIKLKGWIQGRGSGEEDCNKVRQGKGWILGDLWRINCGENRGVRDKKGWSCVNSLLVITPLQPCGMYTCEAMGGAGCQGDRDQESPGQLSACMCPHLSNVCFLAKLFCFVFSFNAFDAKQWKDEENKDLVWKWGGNSCCLVYTRWSTPFRLSRSLHAVRSICPLPTTTSESAYSKPVSVKGKKARQTLVLVSPLETVCPWQQNPDFLYSITEENPCNLLKIYTG